MIESIVMLCVRHNNDVMLRANAVETDYGTKSLGRAGSWARVAWLGSKGQRGEGWLQENDWEAMYFSG